MYTIELNQIIVRPHPGPVGRVVAQVKGNADREAAERLVARANLADRDEQMLDKIAEIITTRNDG